MGTEVSIQSANELSIVPLELTLAPGSTIAEIIKMAEVPEELYDNVLVCVNGITIVDWEHTYALEGDVIRMYAIPSGGNFNQILAAVAVIAIAYFAGPLAGAILGPGVATTSASFIALKAGITIVGTLLVYALVPPPAIAGLSGVGSSQSAISASESPSYSFSGQSNQSRLYQRVPRIYGVHKFTPFLAATPQITSVGKSSRISTLYDFGLGDIEIGNMKVGNLDLEVIDPEYRIHRNSFCTDLDFINRSTAYDQLDYALEYNVPLTIQTKPDAVGSVLDLNFPNGLVRFDSTNERSMHTVGVRVQYRKQGTSSWSVVPASWFKGARKNTENFIFSSHYDIDDLTYLEDVTDAWVVSQWAVKSGPRRRINLFRNGKSIYQEWHNSDFDRVNELTVGGVVYRRGAQRMSASEPGGETGVGRVAYEILQGDPSPNSSVLLSEYTAVPFVVSVDIKFPDPAVWEIRITRTTPVSDTSITNTLRDDMRLGIIKSHRRGNVLNLKKRHTMVEIKYTATDKVSGVIQNFNAIAESRLRDFDASGFNGDKFITSNNATIAIDLLTGDGAKNPMSSSQIDWKSFSRLKDICNQTLTSKVNGITSRHNRYEWNGIFDTDITVKDAIQAVLSPACATLILTSTGKFGVLIDEENNTPRQLITPANSWGFQATRPFIKAPDALRVSFVNQDEDYTPSEVMVYNTGKDGSNAETVEDLQTFGITSQPLAYRYGRYMFAQGIVRSERFSVMMDVENLSVQRGDLVRVQHDVPMFGGLTVRVVAVSGNKVTINAPVEVYNGQYTVRNNNGKIYDGKIIDQSDTMTLVVDKGSNFTVDALVSVDVTTTPTLDYIVAAIEPDSDLTARLELIKYDKGIYNAYTNLPDWDPGFGDDLFSKTAVEIGWGSITSKWIYIDGVPNLQVEFKWNVTQAHETYAGAKIEVKLGNELYQTIFTTDNGDAGAVFYVRYDSKEWFVGDVKVRVTPYNVVGNEGSAITKNVSFANYNAAPLPPSNFAADVRSQEITLYWEPSLSLDVRQYVLRYSPDTVNASWNDSQHLARLSYNQTKFTTGARTGTYFIASENVIKKLSTPVTTVTTIEELPDLNVIASINDAPSWGGSRSNFSKGKVDAYSYVPILMLDKKVMNTALPVGWDNDIVRLDGSSLSIIQDISIPSTYLVSVDNWEDLADDDYAVYKFKGSFDLSFISEVRIQSKIKTLAINKNSYSGELTKRYRAISDSVPDLENDSHWNAWLEYRAIDELNVIEDWVPALDDVVPNISQGTSEFGPWRPINVGDVTGRIFQFRIVAKGYVDGISIVITDGEVSLDMPDRVWRKQNISVPATSGGVTINFDPAFAVPPVLAITIEGATSAVSYDATNISRSSVKLKLLDKNGTSVGGQVDIAALGYGRERASGY